MGYRVVKKIKRYKFDTVAERGGQTGRHNSSISRVGNKTMLTRDKNTLTQVTAGMGKDQRVALGPWKM